MAAKKKKAPKPEPPKLVDLLTPAQRAIVHHGDGPLLAGAVAGAGKTSCMVERTAHLIERRGALLNRLCIVAFNVSAAADLNKKLKKRLKTIPGVDLEVDPARTLHSLALLVFKSDENNRDVRFGNVEPLWTKAIREAHQAIGIKEADVDLVKEFASKVRNDYLPAEPVFGEFSVNKLHADVYAAAQALVESKKAPKLTIDELLHVFTKADSARRAGRVTGADGFAFATFDDILWEAARLLESNERLRQVWQQRYDYITVDEAQDLCEAQWQLIEIMASGHRNICVVADPAQALYSFRGARPEHVISFSERWRGQAIYMEENFRSGSHILDAANRVLDAMEPDAKLPMHLKPTRGFTGHVGRMTHDGPREEAREIASACTAQRRNGREWKEMAILIRLNSQSKDLELEFFRQKVPLRMISGTSFFALKEAKTMLSYFRLIVGKAEEDDLLSAITSPSRFLGKAFVESVARVSKEDGDWVERIPQCDAWKGRAQDPAYQFVEQMREWRGSASRRTTPSQLLSRILEKTQYTQWHMKEQAEGDESSAFVDTMERVRSFTEEFDTVDEMLATVDEMRAQQRSAAQSRNAVTVITVHQCVAPDTLVDTDAGTVQISTLSPEGVIATADGRRPYKRLVRYADCPMLRLTTKYGYEVCVTENHHMMAWTGEAYEPVAAADLHRNQFLRLRIGGGTEPSETQLPASPALRARAVCHKIPTALTEDLAELLGLLVGDGSLLHAGFRVKKADGDVIERVKRLSRRLFGAKVKPKKWYVTGKRTGWHTVEVCSVQIADWLRSIGGMNPRQKAIPQIIWAAAPRVQAAFLRGLFEDGTVNLRDGHVDHIALTMSDKAIVAGVQQLLLRQGIIASRFPVQSHWRIAVYGQQARLFAKLVGFVSARKNKQVGGRVSPETNTMVPISEKRARSWVITSVNRFDRQNALQRGRVSRHVAEKMGMQEDLKFHHDPIVNIERYVGDSLCVEVPGYGRFLQNGFDGCNSKGQEWPVVFIPGVTGQNWPVPWGEEREELRCFYVAVTRARDECWISTYTGNGDIDDKPVATSPYLRFVSPSKGEPELPRLPPQSGAEQLRLV